jgi:hypothetical protein
MDIAKIKQEIYEYIRVADDRKLRAIYSIIESDADDLYEWWNDKELIAELNHRSLQIKSGNDNGVLWEDAMKEMLNSRKPSTSGK